MSTEQRTVLEQLEDALLKMGPGAGAFIGGLIGVGILKDVSPIFVGFIAGATLGGGLVYAILYGCFLLLNPKRDRRRKK